MPAPDPEFSIPPIRLATPLVERCDLLGTVDDAEGCRLPGDCRAAICSTDSMLATSPESFIPLLAPVLAGIVGALGLVLKEWRLARDRRNVRQQALAEA